VHPGFVSCDEHRGEGFVVSGFIQQFMLQTHADDPVRQWATAAQTFLRSAELSSPFLELPGTFYNRDYPRTVIFEMVLRQSSLRILQTFSSFSLEILAEESFDCSPSSIEISQRLNRKNHAEFCVVPDVTVIESSFEHLTLL
jgi:hypothetical protein